MLKPLTLGPLVVMAQLAFSQLGGTGLASAPLGFSALMAAQPLEHCALQAHFAQPTLWPLKCVGFAAIRIVEAWTLACPAPRATAQLPTLLPAALSLQFLWSLDSTL